MNETEWIGAIALNKAAAGDVGAEKLALRDLRYNRKQNGRAWRGEPKLRDRGYASKKNNDLQARLTRQMDEVAMAGRLDEEFRKIGQAIAAARFTDTTGRVFPQDAARKRLAMRKLDAIDFGLNAPSDWGVSPRQVLRMRRFINAARAGKTKRRW